jgi:dihydroorotate dehydrogenase electron transfer subunit
VLAPIGRRLVEVADNRASGAYRIFTAVDRDGPEPRAGQFYMLAGGEHWGSRDGRPFLPRAFSVAQASAGDAGTTLEFLVEGVGPGTEHLAALESADGLWITGPLGRPFSTPGELGGEVAGAILVGGGIGIAPLAIWRSQLVRKGVPTRVLLGFRDRARSGGLDLFVTDLLSVLLEGDDAANAAVYACGPPAMLEAVRAMSAERRVATQLAMEAPMACGFGGCMGCAVPLAEGGYMRLCVDGPVVDASQIESALVPGSGH